MKRFEMRKLHEAEAHAAAGKQALHTHQIIVNWEMAPRCFVEEVEAGRDIAHLFDNNHERLVKTARRLGVRVVVVEHVGKPGQHVDLCRGPLKKALAECVPEDDLDRCCRVCGCTENRACKGGCSWVEADLCSKCAGPA